VEQARGPVDGSPAILLAAGAQCLHDLGADAHNGIQRRLRLLKDHCDPASADAPDFRLGAVADVSSVEKDATFRNSTGGREETQDRQSGERLSAPGLTDQGERLPGEEIKAHSIHRNSQAGARVELGSQASDLQYRVQGHQLAVWRIRRDSVAHVCSRGRWITGKPPKATAVPSSRLIVCIPEFIPPRSSPALRFLKAYDRGFTVDLETAFGQIIPGVTQL